MTAKPTKTPLFVALALVLGLTFLLYAQPEVAVMLAEQLWACF
jgi:hypothetical protein